MQQPVEALAYLAHHRKKLAAVFVVQENVLPTITPRGDVIERTGKFKTKAVITVFRNTLTLELRGWPEADEGRCRPVQLDRNVSGRYPRRASR